MLTKTAHAKEVVIVAMQISSVQGGRLATHFALAGHLIIVVARPVVPREAGFELHWVDASGRERRITRLQDLAGHVRIDRGADALEFVRLASAPVTYSYFGGDLELLPPSQFRALTFGLGPDLQVTTSQFGEWGMVPDGWLTRNGLSPAGFRRGPKGWEVTRWVVNLLKGRTAQIEQVREVVTRDGRVTRRVLKKEVPRVSPLMFWHPYRH